MNLQRIEGMTNGDDTNSTKTSGDQILRHCARSRLLVRHSARVFDSYVMVTKVVFSTSIPFVILEKANVFLFATVFGMAFRSSLPIALRNSPGELRGLVWITHEVVFSPCNCVHDSLRVAWEGNKYNTSHWRHFAKMSL